MVAGRGRPRRGTEKGGILAVISRIPYPQCDRPAAMGCWPQHWVCACTRHLCMHTEWYVTSQAMGGRPRPLFGVFCFVFRFPISEITPEILPIQLCCAPTKPSYGPFEASVWSPRPQLYPHAIFSWWWQNCGRPRPPTVGAVNNDYTVKYTIKPIIKINMVSHHSVQINEFLHACMYTWLYMTS